MAEWEAFLSLTPAGQITRSMDVMREVVAERPEHVHEASCSYTTTDDHGKPCASCLIGHVLARLGMPLDQLAKLDHERYGLSTRAANLYMIIPQLSPAVCAVWEAAQTVQDRRGRWAVALADAERVAHMELHGHPAEGT